MEYWKAQPYAEQKYSILRKYLGACEKFARRYGNFAYIDTHGGSGLIKEEPSLFSNDRITEGSPLLAARIIQSWKHAQGFFPCHIIEIDPQKYTALRHSLSDFSWIHTHEGDCNALLPQIWKEIPSWAFTLCFVDPDGLVYIGGRQPIHEFRWETMRLLASRRKVEVLLNFPLEAILRTGGYCQEHPDAVQSRAMASHLTTYFGCDEWWGLRGKREFLSLYLHQLRSLNFPYLGAYCVYHQRLPVYYLIYATRHKVGAAIMQGVMQGEWKRAHPQWAEEAQQAGIRYPPEEFVFDDEGNFVSPYPLNWHEVARRIKDAAGWRCQECGHPHSPEEHYILVVHHRDGNPTNNDPDNLTALCQRCHLRAQGQREIDMKKAHQFPLPFPDNEPN